jgi:squalene cyclase
MMLRHLGIVIVVLLAAATAPAVDFTDQQVLDILEQEQEQDRAIDRGLAWLRTQQQENGSLTKSKNGMALTGLAIKAHLSAGITFRHREHGPWLRRSLNWMLSMQEPDGYFGKKDGSRMYGHGIATLTLAEVIGMVGDPETEEVVRDALERAVARTVWSATKVK